MRVGVKRTSEGVVVTFTALVRKCKCGGQFRMNMDVYGVQHTYPTCQAYEDLDIEKLLEAGYGQLAIYLYNMEAKAEA